MAHDKRFAEHLKRIRKSTGLTQAEVAELLNIDRSTYAYYETGKTHPDLELLCRMAGIFHLTTDEMIGYEPPHTELYDGSEPFEQTIVNRFSRLTQEEQLLVLQFRQMPDEKREAVLEDLHHFFDSEK